jgi:hypothetical protein
MTAQDHPWRELYRTSELSLAHTIATCIEGMEFEVRLRDALGREVSDVVDEGSAKSQASIRPPFVIHVREQDWAALREVLDDLIAEQEEFDDKLAAAARRSTRVARVVILSAIALAASFAGAASLKQCHAD